MTITFNVHTSVGYFLELVCMAITLLIQFHFFLSSMLRMFLDVYVGTTCHAWLLRYLKKRIDVA